MLVAEWAYNDNNAIIGSLNNTPEQNYPLANVYNKAIITATELDAKFNLAPVSSRPSHATSASHRTGL